MYGLMAQNGQIIRKAYTLEELLSACLHENGTRITKKSGLDDIKVEDTVYRTWATTVKLPANFIREGDRDCTHQCTKTYYSRVPLTVIHIASH